MVRGQGLGLALGGLAVGLAGAFGVAHLLASLLCGVKPFDPAVFIGAALVLVLASLAASYLPARRSSKMEPMAALRYE